MATDKVFDVEVMSVDSSGNLACDGSVTTSGGLTTTGAVALGAIGETSNLSINTNDLSITCDRYCDISAIGGIYLNLPTSDPLVEGALWNDSGTVKVSSGT